MSWRYREISSSSFGYNKYLRRSAKVIKGFATLKNKVSKSVLRKSRLHKLNAFMQKIWGTEMCITMRVITGNFCSKSDSKELVRSFALLVDEAFWKAIDCQQGEANTQLAWFCNGCDDYHCSSFSFVWKSRCFYTCFCIECHCFSCNNLLKLLLRRCIWIILGVEICAFSASFVKECTDVSCFAEGVELTVHQKGKCCCRENQGSRIEISSWANLSMTKITIETQSCT